MIGSPEPLGCEMIGSLTSAGSCWRMRLTASRTSLRAVSVSEPTLNSTIVVLVPSTTVERMWSRPFTPTTASSTLRVMSVSSSVGLAPGRVTVTTIMGKSTSGHWLMPRPRKVPRPITVRSTNSMKMGIGFLMAQAEMFMNAPGGRRAAQKFVCQIV
ncbi:hypothetical protein D3C72_494170 [compost metagenome]